MDELQDFIDACPEKILLKIFGFLDVWSLKKMTLVNKRWYHIVTNSISTMKRLPLIINRDTFTKKHSIVGNWKFHKVLFSSVREEMNKEILLILKRINSTVRELEFFECKIIGQEDIQQILRIFPKVEKISMQISWFVFPYKKSNAEVLNLENLKELDLDNCCSMILSFLGVQLKSLKVHQYLMNFSLMDKETKHQLQMERQLEEEHLMEFLYTQKRLETLRLSFDYRTTKLFPKNDSTLYQFKLKELSLSCQCKKENLKAFLYTQDSVEKLELRCIYLNIALELCLNKFENVKTLCIGEKSFPADFKTLKVNKSVTKLILRRINGDHVKYCKFVSLFPNVTDIIFPSETPFEVLFCLPNLCKALTSLSLHTLLPGNYQNLKFFALKFFHLQKFEGGNNWSDFVLSNPTIETLSFEYSDADDDEQYIDADKIKMVCEALPNLKYLNFGGNMKKKYYLLQNMRKKIQITMIKHGFY